MADDCYDIYIDVGSNRGVQVRKLFEPENYPEASVLPIFDSYFGTPGYRLSNPHLCAFGFEPNPPLEQTLLRLENYYATVRGFRAHFFTRTAVGTAYGEQPFFYYEDRDANVASSLIKSKRGGWMGAKEVETVVTVVDLNHWMHTHVRDRRLPNATSLRQRPRSDKLPAGPMVVMKLDVEGSEYEVLPALYASGVLCATVDLVFLELHERFIFPPKKVRPKRAGSPRGYARAFTPRDLRVRPCRRRRRRLPEGRAHAADERAPPDAQKRAREREVPDQREHARRRDLLPRRWRLLRARRGPLVHARARPDQGGGAQRQPQRLGGAATGRSP